MKSLSALLILFTSIITVSHAQQVDVSPQLLANHTYNISFKGHINYDVMLVGKSPMLTLKLDAAGITLPMNVVEAANIKTEAITGIPDASGQTAFTYSCLKSDYNLQSSNSLLIGKNDDDNIGTLLGKFAKGKVTAKGKIKVDSTTDARLVSTDINRQEMINIFNMSRFSVKKLEVGKSYTIRDVINLMEMSGQMIAVNRKSIYKLIEVTDSKAHFDIVQTVSSTFTNDLSLKSEVSGSGTGKMVFDLNNKMPTEYFTDLKVKLTMPMSNTDALKISYQALAYNNVKIN
jgi:hypothetical protein